MRRAIRTGIAIVLVLGVALAISTNLRQFSEIEWEWKPLPLALGLLGFSAAMLLSADLWRRLLQALGPEIPAETGTRIWFVSGLGRYIPTAVLVPMVRVAMCEREGVPKRISLASVVYEVSLFLIAALAVGAYSLITLPELQGTWQRFLGLLLPVVALICLQPNVFHSIANLALERAERAPLPLALDGRRVVEFVGLYSAFFVLAGLSVYGIALSVYPLEPADLATVVGAYAFGTALAVAAFFLPAGIFAREAGLAVGLTPIMPAASAVAIALLIRIVQIGIELVAVAITLARSATREAPGA